MSICFPSLCQHKTSEYVLLRRLKVIFENNGNKWCKLQIQDNTYMKRKQKDPQVQNKELK